MSAETCRCGAPATCASVDLLANLCWDCLDHFNDWADANRGAHFDEWPGRPMTLAEAAGEVGLAVERVEEFLALVAAQHESSPPTGESVHHAVALARSRDIHLSGVACYVQHPFQSEVAAALGGRLYDEVGRDGARVGGEPR